MMSLSSFLDARAVSTDLKSQTKADVIRELTELLVKSGAIKEREVSKFIPILLKRESLGSTGIGEGVAIPHGKSDCVDRLHAAFGISRQGIPFDSLDGEPAHIFFLLVAPEDSAGPHLKALARISRLLKDKHFRDSLRVAKDAPALLKLIEAEDDRRH